jgi:hypothetical protein
MRADPARHRAVASLTTRRSPMRSTSAAENRPDSQNNHEVDGDGRSDGRETPASASR